MSEPKFPDIPGYRIKKMLGRGGMAAVFLAEQLSIDRDVAMKVMLPQLGADPSFGDRFIREAKIVAKFSHPNIVAIFDVGTAGSNYYMSMELLPGGELKGKIGPNNFPVAEVLRITRQIATALSYAHELGYVHRDVKPENVLFRKDGTAVLSDFGIARTHDNAATRMTATGMVVGTPYYMSPEQVQGKNLDGRSDLYSLGIMFFEMLTGKVPFTAESAFTIGMAHLKDPIPQLPKPLARYQNLLERMVAKGAADRYQTGAEIVRVIEVLERGASAEIDPHNAPTKISAALRASDKTEIRAAVAAPLANTTSPVRGLAIGGLGAVVVVAVIAGVYFYSQQGAVPEPAAQSEVTPQVVAVIEAPKPTALPIPLPEAPTKDLPAAVPTQQKPAASPVPARAPQNRESRTTADTQPLKTAAIDTAKQEEANRRLAIEQEQLKIAAAEKTKQEEADRRAREEQLNTLLNRARDYLSPTTLTPARAAQAYDLYREAERMAPNDSRTAQGTKLVADAYGSIASARADAKQFDEAETLVLKGLEINPGNSQLLALQKDIGEKKNVKKPQRTFGGF